MARFHAGRRFTVFRKPSFMRVLPHELRPDLEQELGRQILRSEKQRATLVAGIGGLIVAMLAITAIIMNLRGMNFIGWDRAAIIGICAIIYELGTRHVFGYFLKRDRQPPIIGRFVNAAIETSIPTLVLLVLSQAAGAVVAMGSAAPFAYFFFIILSAMRLDFWLSAASGMVAAIGLFGLTWYYADELRVAAYSPPLIAGYFLRPIMLLIAGIVAGLVARQIREGILRSMRATEERRRVVQMFGEHVSPAVVNQLLTQPTGTQSELRHVCICVLDIRNFTTFSETAAPDDVVAYLNQLWSSSVAIVNRHHGIVNKFLGDGFLAIFGAPLSNGNDCENALAAAREMLAHIENASTAGEIPPTKVGIALHAGPALVGNIGSTERREYTVIGDVVNVAFRIEQLNKKLGSQLLVSEDVRQAIPHVDFAETPLSLPIRGRQQNVQVYRLA